MKVIPSIAFGEFSGSAGDVTARSIGGRTILNHKAYQAKTKTPAQAVSRNTLSKVSRAYKQLSQAWQSLTNEQILAWNSAAQSAEARSVLSTKTKITGSNLFMRLNYWVVFCGGDIMETPPTLGGVEAPASATLALSATAFTLTLASIPSSVTNLKLVICASAPQSNGISRAYSKAAEFIAPQTPVTTAIALKTAYDGKYSAPSAGAPKVFVKYFYVNTATGEKSGEMLGVATLSSSEEDGD